MLLDLSKLLNQQISLTCRNGITYNCRIVSVDYLAGCFMANISSSPDMPERRMFSFENITSISHNGSIVYTKKG